MSSNLYLITGDEAFEKEQYLEKIKTDFGELVKGINYIVLDKDSVSSLESEINTYAFGYSKKLIIVKFEKKSLSSENGKETDSAEEKVDWLTESLEQALSELEDVIVVFYGDFQKRSRVYKLVQKYGECVLCEKKKEYELLTWCVKIFKENNINISNADVTYLINLCGTDKLALKNEIDKLIDYSAEDKTITKEIIDLLCIRTSDVIIFDLTDSLGNKNPKAALKSLNELLENKEPIQKIVIMIAKHFKSLLVAKVASIQGKNVMDELATKSAYASSKYLNQSRSFSLSELQKIIRALAKLDIDSKTGMIDLKIGLERIICS